MRSRLLLGGLALAACFVGAVSAQTIPFTLLVTENGNAATVSNDSNLSFSTTVGTQAQATLQATYTGTSQATLTAAPSTWLVGSTEFKVTSTVTTPMVLNPGDNFKVTITFSPVNSAAAAAQLTIPFSEPGQGGAPATSAIVLVLQGFSPAFTLSYVLQTQNNVVQIPDGGTIPFDATQINTTAAATLNITDTGSGPGEITAITPPPAGSPFKIQGIPLLPFPIGSANSSSTLSLLVTYTPTVVGNDMAQVQITFQGGATETVNLTGSGTTSTFTYTYLESGMATAVMPGETIVLAGANVGGSSSLIVQVKNTGNANGTVNSVSISNPEFVLSNVPVTIPTLKPGDLLSFTITFMPTQVGTQKGQLVVGNDFFNLSGQGLGPKLTFAYTSSAGTTTVDPTAGGAVVFSPIAVGKSEQVSFAVTNSGSLPATISNIGTNPTDGPYTVSGVALPLSLESGKSAQFTVTFKPTVTGFQNGSLILDTVSIPLIGSGTAPPTLPAYTLTGPSGNAAPQTQSNVSLTLAQPYSLDLNGTLTITTQGQNGTDPAVQFATGGRTVPFTIAANSTAADFAGQGPELPLQTGTVAETVTLTPTFTTADGVNVTPASPATLQFIVPSQAPVLLSANATGQGGSSFTLTLIGYSTTRSLASLSVTFNPASGFNVGSGQVTVDLTHASTGWFQSSASEAFGGQFQIAVPFTLSGTPKSGQTLLQSIASVTATVSNNIGTSGPLQTTIQ